MLTLRGSCTSLTALCSIFRTAPLHVSLSQRVPQKRETRSLQRCCLGQLAHLRFHTSPNELELQISWTLTLLSADISQQVQSHYREESPRAWEDSLLIGCEVMFVNYKTGILNITYLPLFLLFHISVLLSMSSSDSSLGLLFIIFWYQNSLCCSCGAKHFLVGLLSPLQSHTPKSSAHYYLLILLGCGSCSSDCFLFLQVTVIHQSLSGFEFWLKRQLSY